MKIQTVNQLISVFKDISTRHYQINGFGIGDNWENGTSEKMHPVLWINPTTATMPSTDNGYKTFEIDFEVRVFDLVNKDESNENEVLSDCIDILKDIITEFKGHPYYVNSQLNIIDDINFEAFTEEFDEEVSGWVCEISLMTPVLTSFCGIPSAEITGFEFPGADCPEVNVLCPVFVEDVTGVYPIVVTTTGTTKEVSIVGGVGADTFVISGEYDNGTLTLTRNDNIDVVVTGFDTGGDNDYTTAATLSGNIITFDRTDTVGAYSVDLTTAINSAPDKFVSSGAYDAINNKIVLTLNDASTVDIDTSAIGGGGGGGNSIYTADGTIGTGRVATLTDSLTFKDGTVNVQGAGTSTGSALAIYDNDTTPTKLWDFLDNGNASGNGTLTVNTEGKGVSTKSLVFEYDSSNGYNTTLDFRANGFLVGQITSNKNSGGDHNLSMGDFDDLEALTIRNGNVGINDTNPLSKFSVVGSANVDGTLTVNTEGDGVSTKSLVFEYDNAVGYETTIDFTSNGFLVGQIRSNKNGGGDHTLSFGDVDDLDALTIRNGNVGINDDNPSSKFSVKGSGTGTASNLALQDSGGAKVFEVLDNSTIKTNGNAGFTGTGAYTNFTIENGIITNAS